jgi:hypothetical protein
MPTADQQNEAILAMVEGAGGAYVWDAECFAVTLMDVQPPEDLARALQGLVDVQQIAIEASMLRHETLMQIASIPGLTSLVLNHSHLSAEELLQLRTIGPEIVQIEETA